jgi:outer membrane murein-binding lipoprotein Lpp
MVIQRIIKDSYRGIQNDSMKNTTNADLLEKYIVQTLQKEMRGQIKQDAAVAGESATEMQKKMDLLSTILEKLNSMERMYNRVHSDSKQQRKQIKAAVRDPVQEAMKLLDTNPNLYMD